MRRPFSLVVVAAIVGAGSAAIQLAAPALAAGGVQNWTQAQPATSPPHDITASAAFDEATGQLVLAPGESGTWTWDGANWTQQHPAASPANRQLQAVGYDDATKQVVLFGGVLVHSTRVLPTDGVNDTWTWNGETWAQQHPATSPPNGTTCAAYDPATNQFLMFDVGTISGQPATWSWTGTNWVQLTVDAGPAGSCTMNYDPDLHELLLLQADSERGVAAGMPVWAWDGTTWVPTSMTIPIQQAGVGSMAYDTDVAEEVAVVSVITSPPPYWWPTSELQTWVLANGVWSRGTSTTPAMTLPLLYDSATHQLISIDAAPAAPATSGLTWIYGPGGTSIVTPTRVFGADRQSTAVAVSQSSFPSDRTAPAVVLARADAFPDALAGGPLAAAKEGPLLLTSSGTLDAVTKTEIQRVLKPGGTVFLLGGTAALSASISTAISALGFTPARLAGADRFGTAIAIAAALGNPSTVFEANGEGFADALSAVPAAVAEHGVILLTNGAAQPAATSAYLKAHPGAHYAIGGPAATADASAVALVGADRYATSAAVARAFFPSATGISAASGESYPDALAGGPVAGSAKQPMLLVPPTGALPEPAVAYLQTRNGTVSDVTVFGGQSAVADDVLSQIAARLAVT